jgi:hypothetical protein
MPLLGLAADSFDISAKSSARHRLIVSTAAEIFV